MLIVCPSCATAYDVEMASLRPNGRQVRCVRCRAVWRAEVPQAEKLLAAAAALAPEADAADGGHAAVAHAHAGAKAAATEPGNDFLDEEQPVAGDAAADAGTAPEGGEAEPDRTAEVEAPPIAPVDLDEGRPPLDVDSDHPPGAHGEDIETAAARRRGRTARRNSLRWPLTALQTTILLLVVFNAVLIGWRGDVVRLLPQTASLYARIGLPVNVRGLVFDGIATSQEQHEGVPILVVEGNIVNDVRRTVDVPRVKFIVRNSARQEIYSWTAVPSRTVLEPGEAVSFRTRLASPPPEARDVLVRFVSRRDLLAIR